MKIGPLTIGTPECTSGFVPSYSGTGERRPWPTPEISTRRKLQLVESFVVDIHSAPDT
jgi:hypothetical protein